jgi:hypothetical protein
MILDNASNDNASSLSAHEERLQTALTSPAAELNFFSDAPLAACPLRNNGDETCEACQ